jgi:hypothetical protein
MALDIVSRGGCLLACVSPCLAAGIAILAGVFGGNPHLNPNHPLPDNNGDGIPDGPGVAIEWPI